MKQPPAADVSGVTLLVPRDPCSTRTLFLWAKNTSNSGEGTACLQPLPCTLVSAINSLIAPHFQHFKAQGSRLKA